MERSVWSVVLAAGMGRRLSPVTGEVPKQFWRPDGTTSLLEETLARMSAISPAARTLVVVDQAHRGYVSARSRTGERAQVLFQPGDRGTAAGVLFGLSPVLAADPDATVVVTPSDHGVRSTKLFLQGIFDAVRHVESSGGVVLLGVTPSTATGDLGWITLGTESPRAGIRSVSGFVEKPHAAAAAQLLAGGAIWNTMVMVARARDLVSLSATHVPDMTSTFLRALDSPAADQPALFREMYPLLPCADLSRDVLTPARGLMAYTWPSSIGWSDLGTPERLGVWLKAAPRYSNSVSDADRHAVAATL